MTTGGPGREESEEATVGWCAPELEQELPGLRLLSSRLQLRAGRPLGAPSPPQVRARLAELSDRLRGPRAVAMRREPVPAAYRVFFRQTGLDPDIVRTPIEEAVFERMLRGGFLPSDLLHDVLLIALADTGVPVWALASDSVQGSLGIRASNEGEPLGRAGGSPLSAGRLVLADDSAAVGVLFGELAPECAPGRRTTGLLLFTVQVPGVPTLYAQEALWGARNALQAA